METYALSPLFVEHARKALSQIVGEFADVIDRSGKPSAGRALASGEAAILKSLGCSTKDESAIFRSLFLPQYLRQKNSGRTLWEIIGANTQRKMLFSGRAWLDSTIESDAIGDLEARHEVREKVRQAISSEHDDSSWEALAEVHLDEFEGDRPA